MKRVAMIVLLALAGCRSAPVSDLGPYAVIVPMLTCYMEGDPSRVDLAATAQLTDWLCETRATALFPVSGMGQWKLLTLDEKAEIFAAVVKASRGRKPVFAGVGSTASSRETLLGVEAAERAGVAGLVLVTPDFLRGADGLGQGDLVAYCESVCRATSLPVILYDPKHEVLPATLERLSAIPNLRAMKYRTDSAKAMVRMTRAAAGKVEILAGIEHTTLTTLAAGGGGVVGGGSNLFPDLLADLVCAYRAGDPDEARRLQWIVLEANERLKALGGKLAIKRLLRELGLDRIAVNNRGPTKQQPATGAATWRESAAWFERTCGVRRAQSSR